MTPIHPRVFVIDTANPPRDPIDVAGLVGFCAGYLLAKNLITPDVFAAILAQHLAFPMFPPDRQH